MSKIAIALDKVQPADAVQLAKKLSGKVWGYKLRLDTLLRAGGLLITQLAPYGSVFVDPKDYDITNSQANDLEALAEYGVDLVTVHASGGRNRLKKAAAEVAGSGMQLAAVTILTDYPDEDVEEVYNDTRPHVVLKLANLAKECGINGLVCSAAEVSLFKDWDMLRVLPGFRPGGAVKNDDQLRVAGYEEAKMASIVVVGRPIIQADDPLRVVEEMNEGMMS